MIISQKFKKAIPDTLKSIPQWVCWRFGELRPDGKQAKTPYTPTGIKAKVNDLATWSSWEQVCSASGFAGIGFVFSGNGLIGIDLDKCLSDGILEPWAKKIIDHVASYTEISPSGKGVHILIKGTLPAKGIKRKGQIEVYDTARYFTVTGNHLEGTPPTINQYDGDLLGFLFPPVEASKVVRKPTKPESLDDTTLIAKACKKPEFSHLWQGDFSAYSSQSEADLALCSMLAFWTAKDPDRIDRLFRQSGLMRDKWQDHPTYSQKTIEKAIATCSKEYSPPEKLKEEKTPIKNTGGGDSLPAWGFQAYTASEIWEMDIPPIMWIVEGILPEGLAILSGPPKIGKSFLCLNIGLALASGGKVLGKIPVNQAECIYFALEDNNRRIQDRLELIEPDRPQISGLSIATFGSLKNLADGGLDQINIWLEHHPQTKLVIIDTFVKVKPGTKGKNVNPYEADSIILNPLHKLALSKNICILLIHHNAKAKVEDFINSPSGSMANTGTADTIMVLTRGRGGNQGKLQLTGRDVTEQTLAIEYHEDFGRWELLGDYSKVNLSPQRKEIIEFLKANGPMRMKPMAEKLGKELNNINQLLRKMLKAGEIRRDPVRGFYI